MNCIKFLSTTIFKTISTLLLINVLYSCAKAPVLLKENYLLFIKSENLKFNDVIFMRITKKYTIIDALSVGKSVASIKVSNKNDICLNYLCQSGSAFNAKYFDKTYEKNFLFNILNKKPLFHKKHYKKTKNGFIQRKGTIIYKKKRKNILFKDKKRKITIKLTKI